MEFRSLSLKDQKYNSQAEKRKLFLARRQVSRWKHWGGVGSSIHREPRSFWGNLYYYQAKRASDPGLFKS